MKDINCSLEPTGLTSHMEDYMEAIGFLSKNNRVIRVKDIAKKLSIKMPSVTAALNKLKSLELIDYEKYGFVELTEKGNKIAENVIQRHLVLADFFKTVLRIEINESDMLACKVEHAITPEACIKINKLLEFFKTAESKNEEWTVKLKELI